MAHDRIAWHNRFWASHGLGVWSLRLKEAPDEIVGWVGFAPSSHGTDAEIFYGIARPHWGHGYASEAAETAVRWLYENTEYQGISASIFPGNPGSERIAQKLGMERGEDIPVEDFAENIQEVHDVVDYDLWRLRSAKDETVAAEIGHRIGLMSGDLLDGEKIWSQVEAALPSPHLQHAVRAAFQHGKSNPALLFFRADRPA